MGAGTDTGGLTTALAMLGAAGVLQDDVEGQDDLFEAPAPLPLPTAPRADAGKPGRPKGARNKSTDEWVRYFLGRYRSPLTGLAELYTRDLGDLVGELQRIADEHCEVTTKPGNGEGSPQTHTVHVVRINPLEVLRLQQSAMAALLPYIHKKQPMALEIDQKPRGVVLLGSLDVADIGGDDDLALPLGPIVENQQVSGAVPAQSESAKSEMQPDQSLSHGND